MRISCLLACFFLLALRFVWATVRLFVKKPEEEEKKEAEV